VSNSPLKDKGKPLSPGRKRAGAAALIVNPQRDWPHGLKFRSQR
jgi:hypothetical protein